MEGASHGLSRGLASVPPAPSLSNPRPPCPPPPLGQPAVLFPLPWAPRHQEYQDFELLREFLELYPAEGLDMLVQAAAVVRACGRACR